MKRASLIGLISLLGSACGTDVSTPPAVDPLFVDPPPAKAIAQGYSWDPEAFFLSVSSCNEFLGGTCPIPPLLADLTPFLPLSTVEGSTVLVVDPLATPEDPPMIAAPTGPNGLWRVENVPSRDEVPFFIANLGTGALVSLPPEATAPLPPVAAAPYLPTATLRPFFTGSSSFCPLGESIHTSDRGVLEAVARYRSANKQATTVADFLNPAKFDAVMVFWLYTPAVLPNLLTPADHTTVQGPVGTRYHIGWKHPGTAGPTQSRRGFYVEDKAPSSSIGVTVVVVPAGSVSTPTVDFLPVDTVTDAAQGRPFQFMPLPLPAIPGMISAMSLQLFSGAPGPDPEDVPYTPTPSFLCLF